ncbi:MAG: small subunit ribosomal protein S9 [Parcubacteria group bacterium Licking1014_17]|nr:MAG: small subunit ribosomal protein S9 [Parcubacteria group bacterium Licking1014_17]
MPKKAVKKEKKPAAKTPRARVRKHVVAKEEIKNEAPALDLGLEPEIKKEPAVSEQISEEQKIADATGPQRFYESVGRRKSAIARVRVFTKKSTDPSSEEKALITVNGKPYYEYFKDVYLHNVIESPLRKLKSLNRFKAVVKINGGGLAGQADAIKYGISKALVLFDANFSKKLKKAGFLTRDARVKERRKYGLKKARKSPQWSKR